MLGKKHWTWTYHRNLASQKTFFTSFPIRLLENIWIEYVFPYGLLPHHKAAKQDTIRVTRWTNVKLPHHKGLVPVYPM
jgi:hypothetical protein